jgi:hypothetical protein
MHSADKVDIELIRSIARSTPKATVGSLRQDRKGMGTDLSYMLGKVVLCPSLRSHRSGKLGEKDRGKDITDNLC